jgi:hypothetical protein
MSRSDMESDALLQSQKAKRPNADCQIGSRVTLRARTGDRHNPYGEHVLTQPQYASLVTFAARDPISSELVPRLIVELEGFTRPQFNSLRQFLKECRGPVTVLDHTTRRPITPAESYAMRTCEGPPPPGVPEPEDVGLVFNGFTGCLALLNPSGG